MSSGRDVWMESWSQEQNIRNTQEPYIKKTQIQSLKEYRQVLISNIEYVDNLIKELENAQS